MQNCSCAATSKLGGGFPQEMCGYRPQILACRGVDDMLGEQIHDETRHSESANWESEMI